MKGAVASGHPLTSMAANNILEQGGNAFDAIIAAGFASTVAEPTLTSLGGGGFLLIHDAKNQSDDLIDFFVNSPGLGASGIEAPHMPPVDIKFRSSTQRFHIGPGSVAVPGTLRGLIYCYEKYCSLDLGDIMRPALEYLRNGIEVNGPMAYLFHILCPILTYNAYGKEIYYLKEGEMFYNPLLLEFLADLSPENWLARAYGPDEWDLPGNNYLITGDDLRSYKAFERKPLVIGYREHDIVTNPPPSLGGILIALTFALYKQHFKSDMAEADRLDLLASAMKVIIEMLGDDRKADRGRFQFASDLIESTRRDIDDILMGGSSISSRGTTHISVIDADGNAASMTASNGTNSGCFLGNTGIILNNMMGEDDLHPNGFYSLPPGRRVSSMMSPSFIRSGSEILAVLGSGGSKRIRTAIPQTVLNILDKGMGAVDSVCAPRIHFDDDGILQIEPGLDAEIVDQLGKHYDINLWSDLDMYFGGVNIVMKDHSGYGDPRRGGNFMQVKKG
ncbi:MAG: gamma-glutamyltransferase [Nitrospirota bacterium]|nr:MAG: gamma-glutamyltransferase [Nitrospirota bacterium]